MVQPYDFGPSIVWASAKYDVAPAVVVSNMLSHSIPLAKLQAGLVGQALFGAGIGADSIYRPIDAADVVGFAPAADARIALHVAVADPHTQYQLRSEKGNANGYTPLDSGGKVPINHLPALAITDTFTVASDAAMTGLTAEKGDIALRTDLNQTFILAAEPASVSSNWVALLSPVDGVFAFNSRNGAVFSASGDYTASQITNVAAGNISSVNVQSALNELDIEKFPISGGTMTGDIVLAGNATSALNPLAKQQFDAFLALFTVEIQNTSGTTIGYMRA
jgi:hypothetical protein